MIKLLNYKFLFLLFLNLCLGNQIMFSQNKIDSLENVLANTKNNNEKIVLHESLTKLYALMPQRSLFHASQMLKIAFSVKDTVSMIKAYIAIAQYHYNKSDYILALENHALSIKLAEKTNNLKLLADNKSRLGSIYRRLKNYDLALDYKFQAKKIFIELKAEKELGRIYFDLANIYYRTKKFDSTFKYTTLALPIVRRFRDSTYIASSLAIEGNVYAARKEYDKALEKLMAPEHRYMLSQNAGLIATNFNDIGGVYLLKQKWEKSKTFYEKALTNGLIGQSKEEVFRSYDGLAKIFAHYKQFDKAYEYNIKASKYKDSIFNQESNQKAVSMQFAYENEKNLTKINLLAKDATINKDQNERKNLLLYMIFGFLILAGILLFIVLRNSSNKQKANNLLQKQKAEISDTNLTLAKTLGLLENKSREIHESINYALRIQSAMLPANESIEKVLGNNNFFVLNKPRDIVSGDFYWFANLENITIISVADCTGHGVPGALMSMIGMNLLDEIVNTKKIIQPDKILNQMHKGINYALKQDETTVKDGMDMMIISLIKSNQDTNAIVLNKINKFDKLQYAGAMNSLIYIENNELLELKANKNPIGGHQSENEKRIFTMQELDISTAIMIYLFTDGYQDQFGGKERKKFMVRKFKELLVKIYKKELKHQKQILDSTIENWKNEANEEQVDDILVLGISLV